MTEIDKKIIFFSEPAEYSMADDWYEIATGDHFWLQLRFDVLRKLASTDTFTGRVLDIGCGHGVSRGQIEAHYNCTVDGCDLNLPALLKAAPKKGNLFFYNIYDKRSELKERFSTVILFDVLEHIEDCGRFLRAVSFHLSNGGRLVINVPSLQMLYSRYDLAAGHVRRYSIFSLKKELSSAGFEIERATYWGIVFIPLLLIRKLVLCFISKDKIISVGFQPSGKVSTFILRLLSRLERKLPFHTIAGTSLMVIAKKME